MTDRRIDATDPIDLNGWLVLLMHKSELVLAHAIDFYWFWVFKKKPISFFVRLDHHFVLLICAPARSSIPLAIFERAWFCDRTFLFLWGATTNFLLPLTGVSVGTLRMTFCSPSSFKLSPSDFWKLFSSSVNWLSKSLTFLWFCKLNERSSLPSAKWRL